MSTQNRHFQHLQRPAFELGSLLRDLPRTPDLDDADTRLKLEAADRHAENYFEVMIDGLESLGRVMWSAGTNDNWPVEQQDVARLGTMISHVAVQLQFLDEFRQSVRDRIEEADQKGASK